MSLLIATGVSTKLRGGAETVTPIARAWGVTYQPSLVVIEKGPPDEGKFETELHRIGGQVWSHDDGVAETLFELTDAIDLIVYYTTPSGEKRKRTFSDVIFGGEAIDTEGILAQTGTEQSDSVLFGVPFRVHIADTETCLDHITDAVDS